MKGAMGARWCAIGLIAMVSAAAQAQQTKTNVLAKNGVQVEVLADDFAGRAEYTAPTIRLPEDGGFVIVAALKQQGKATSVMAVGSIYYEGDWRRYDRAIFRGGEKVDATFDDRDVVTCSGSRYRGCTLREGFQLAPTPAQIQRHTEDGRILIQLSAGGISPVMLSIPVSYFEAVGAVSGAAGWPEAPSISDPPEEGSTSEEASRGGLW